MEVTGDILGLLRAESIAAERKSRRALIIQPGAIGDSILTLPLVEFMKKHLNLGGVDFLGHTDYIGFFPGRTCVDCVLSIDSMDLHRLYIAPEKFMLVDRDPLISSFFGYSWIVTFLGQSGSDFEKNLVFTANCSHSVEVVTLSFKPPKEFSGHLVDFYFEQFICQSDPSLQDVNYKAEEYLIKPMKNDFSEGHNILTKAEIKPDEKVVVLHPGGGAKGKCWHLDNFVAVAGELLSKGFKVLFLLGPAELERLEDKKIKQMASVAPCLKNFPLQKVLSLLSCVDGYIGNDSGVTHLAAGLGCKTAAIFGPTNPAVYKPLGPDVRVFINKAKSFATKPSQTSQKKLLDIFFRC